MTKVKSTKSITFPKLGWAISAGEVKELPKEKSAQARILDSRAEPDIIIFDDVDEEKKVVNKNNHK